MKLEIKLQGTRYRRWPTIRIIFNNQCLYDGKVESELLFEQEVPLEEHNSLVIEHYGKRFGEQGIWDTQVDGDKVIQDCAFVIDYLKLGGVDMQEYVDQFVFHKDNGDEIHTTYFGYNGRLAIEFPKELYDWVILKFLKKKDPTQYNFLLETSHSNLFYYEEDLELIDELMQLLKDNEDLLSKSSKI